MTWRGRTWKSRGGRLKRDINDDLYSKIIRLGHQRCAMCGRVKSLECAHIMGRTHYSTRFMLKPIRNAVPLCNFCHSWFDEHKITSLLFDEKKRVLGPKEESYSWLVHAMGYSWDDLAKLYVLSKQAATYYDFRKKEITKELKATLSKLEDMLL